MPIIPIDDRSRLEKFLRRHPYLHLYALGDLDDFFWPDTTWYGFTRNGQLTAICMLYNAITPSVLLALGVPENLPSLQSLVAGIHQNLPINIYGHLSPGLKSFLTSEWKMEPHGGYLKMAYLNFSGPEIYSTHKITPITPEMAPETLALCQASNPNHAFEPRMLATEQFLGIRKNGKLVSAGGVHVYSPTYRVAALGNIVTHPAYRGQGMASAITSALCRRLSVDIDHIGLNVKANNSPAIQIYQRCGFCQIAAYEEILLTKKSA